MDLAGDGSFPDHPRTPGPQLPSSLRPLEKSSGRRGLAAGGAWPVWKGRGLVEGKGRGPGGRGPGRRGLRSWVWAADVHRACFSPLREDQEKRPWDDEPPQPKPLTHWKGEFLGQQETGAWKGLGLPPGDRQPPALSFPRRCPPHGGSNPDPGREATEWVRASRVGRAAHPGRVWDAAAAGQGERTSKEVAQCYWGTLRHSCLPPCSWPVPPSLPSPLPCPLRPSSGDC